MFTLAHLSDPHLSTMPRPTFRELFGKRAIGYFNWRARRAVHHQFEYLQTLVQDLLARGFDHLAVTGDLVNLGLPGEFPLALEFLESLGDGQRVSMVPGNHDAYVRGTAMLHLDLWKDYIAGDPGARRPGVSGAPFPYLRRRGPLGIVGLSTAIPTAPLLATGRLGKAQLAELEHLLDLLAKEKRFRVVLIHHPPTGLRSPHERLTDAEAFKRVIARHGAELILHGHDHRASVRRIAGPSGEVAVVGVPSASNPGSNAERGGAYNLYRIEGDPKAWRCSLETYGFAPDGSGVATVNRVEIF
jgi:3',5'-cyclic AMP phosphodiesterase CpdA